MLLKVTDATADNEGFKDGTNTNDDYAYDANGNMTKDENKGITKIIYNHLNLPTQIIFGDTNQKITYLYAATGQKMQKQVTQNSHTATTQYMGGYQYSNTRLQFFPTAEGYVKNTIIQGQNSYDYIYNLTDHLGNIRMSFGLDPKTQQLVKFEENNYYPFGLKHSRYNDQLREITEKQSYNIQLENFITEKRSAQKTLAIPSNPDAEDIVLENSGYQYKYNGKEFQDELGLNMYDYGWRNYMPDIGRWTQIDPLFNDLKFANDINSIDEDDPQEVYMSIINDLELGGAIYNTDNLNPYGYGYNNPVSFDDPDGRCPACWGAAMGALVEYGGQFVANLAEGKSLGKAMTDIDVADVLVSAGEGAITGGVSAIRSVTAKTAITVGSEIIKNTLDVKVKGGKPSVKVNDAKTVARNTVIGLAVNGAGKAIPSPKVKVKSEITPKQAVKTARTNGAVTRAERKEIQTQAKKVLKDNKTINKTVNGSPGATVSGGTAETVKRKEDRANGN